jgi:hypothetical protein
MSKKKLGMGLALATLTVAATASAANYWTSWVSEESGGPQAGCTAWNEAVSGQGCSGSYCDNLRLLCTTLPFGATIDSTSVHESGWFSEETDGTATWVSEGWYKHDADNSHVCNWGNSPPAFITGIRCSGKYCDNIKVECGEATAPWFGNQRLAVGVTNCSWTGWYSEEQGTAINFGTNRYATGVECNGSYCDQKRFYVCSMVDPTPEFEIGAARPRAE